MAERLDAIASRPPLYRYPINSQMGIAAHEGRTATKPGTRQATVTGPEIQPPTLTM
jgi:hypothetical protein